MEINKSFLDSCIRELIQERDCFHSEDDFKFSLAWKIKNKIKNAEIRLEKPFREIHGKERSKPFHLDIFVKLGRRIGIELKYKTKELKHQTKNGEEYFLKSHVAVDLGRHDFCKDIKRIETLIKKGELDYGFVIFLTNDTAYWKQSSRLKEDSYDKNFRIHEGVVLKGTLKWYGKRKRWLSKDMYKPIKLMGKYEIRWYNPDSKADKNFRYTIVEIIRFSLISQNH